MNLLKALLCEVHDYIEMWHESDDCNMQLFEFLGMTEEEYSRFVQDERNLGAILYSRKNKVPLNSIFQKDYSIAARSNSVGKEEEIEEWLNSMGIN